ncbi:60S ribosomal protein L38 [Aspergillus udagawae]|uniref:60S ribosomal protein L38 n=1 Tax=Aspergillus udagawae TaxID=91492 RepID=A0A8H3NAL8_9EURO|nr:60S ribosomal protein L38 [Aspergillus udagawae]
MPPQPPKGTDPAFECDVYSSTMLRVAFWRRNRVRVHLSKKDPRSRNGVELGDVPYTTAPFPHGFAPSRADAASVIHHPNPIYRDASRVTDNIAPGIVPWQWRQHQPQEEERL